uniref:Reprolysin n=1 Tax=Rhipicephalus appendiculatus TaxID=34631 RepID=A0A131YCZ1_RHIAP
MAPLKYGLCSLPALLAFAIWTAQMGSLSGGYMRYYVELLIYEDGVQPHPLPELQEKNVYYSEVAMAVSRRLTLLAVGQFKVMIQGIYTLTPAQSSAVFLKNGRLVSVENVYKRLMYLLRKNAKANVHHNDFAVVVTRRQLVTQNGVPTNGFTLRGSMCTGQNIAVVKDDGAFDMVNHLLKVLLYAFGVDLDGSGFARKCPNSGGFLLGTGKLNIPFSFSYCTKAQITSVLRRSICIRRQMKNKTSKGLPMPRKIGRTEYCKAIGAVNCDDDGMETIEHLGTEKTACRVFCCTSPKNIKEIAAPDGLDCSNDLTGLLDMRCLNGMCKQLR